LAGTKSLKLKLTVSPDPSKSTSTPRAVANKQTTTTKRSSSKPSQHAKRKSSRQRKERERKVASGKDDKTNNLTKTEKINGQLASVCTKVRNNLSTTAMADKQQLVELVQRNMERHQQRQKKARLVMM